MSLSQSFGKNKDKKKEEAKDNKPSRVRMTWTNGAPTIHETRLLLAEAEKTRGILCELPIRTPLGTFVLSCQSDHLSQEPCWTLYKGEDGTQQLWSYMKGDADMINDIVGMSVTGKDSKTNVKLPNGESLAKEAPAADDIGMQQAGWGGSALQAQPWGDAPAAATTPDVWAPPGTVTAPPPEPEPMPMTAAPAPEPYAPPQQAWTPPGQPYMPPAQGYPPPDAWGAQPPAQSPYAPQQGYMPPEMQWAQQQQQHAPMPAYTPPQPAEPSIWQRPSDSPWTGAGAAGGQNSMLKNFAAYLADRTDATLAELTMDPTVPSVCADIAMRLQEMVLKGHFNEQVAIVALRFAAENNGILDDSVISKAKAESSADPNETARQAAELLQSAGLLTAQDIAKAEQEIAKHKNSFATALISSGKIDQLVLDAAQECKTLLDDGRLRQDKAIIALHYCSRSRAKLSDAIEDLSIELL